MLRSHIGGQGYFAAGLPWFETLLGRDSIVTALQMLAFDPQIAAQTLRLLAGYQRLKMDARFTLRDF
jgi:glycogen debranching enzyme